MSEVSLARRLRVPVEQLEQLFVGRVLSLVALRINVDVPTVQAFVDGDVRPGMARALGLPMEELDLIGRHLDQEGRIGLLLGRLLYGRTRALAARKTASAAKATTAAKAPDAERAPIRTKAATGAAAGTVARSPGSTARAPGTAARPPGTTARSPESPTAGANKGVRVAADGAQAAAKGARTPGQGARRSDEGARAATVPRGARRSVSPDTGAKPAASPGKKVRQPEQSSASGGVDDLLRFLSSGPDSTSTER